MEQETKEQEKTILGAVDPAQATIRILLIEQDHDEFLVIGRLLSKVMDTDYQLTWCDQMGGVLEEVLSDRYDVVLLDYYCGDYRGCDLLRAAQAQGCRIPIVVMTDEMETDVDRQVISAGASDYLVKGRIDSQLLERTIRYAIERKGAEMELARLAHYDPLTNIPNRILFRECLEHAVQLADRDQLNFALMYLDLDGFKEVNDTFGHDVGDELICAFANRLRACMRSSDAVARIGGDEFTLLLEHTDNSADIAHIAEKILEVVTRPYRIDRHRVEIGCSIGIAVYPDGTGDAQSLEKYADMAMYEAKQEVGNSYRFFTEAMNRKARRQLLLETELRRALHRGEFVLYYQPRVDLISGVIVGLEALVRWNHPERGLVPPAEFLSTAESTGLIAPLGYWALHRACLDLQRIHQQGLPPVTMAVNLSLRQLHDEKLVERVTEVIEEAGIRGEELELEITESVIVENLDLVTLCMRALTHLGVRFSVDDFGSACSSFMHLQQLPIATLQIDRRFIAGATESKSGTALVNAMINLAHNLDKQIIAEGVESRGQLQLLQHLGCDQVQGYFFGRPASFSEISRLLAGAPVVSV